MRSPRPAPRLALAAVCGAFGLAATGLAAPPMRIAHMTFVASSGPLAELVVQADRAVVDPKAQRADLEQVHAVWSDDAGRPSLELDCERGEFDLETNDLVAMGDVQGRLGDGRRFAGPWLRYDRARGVAFTDAPVTILDAGRTLRGGGLRYQIRNGRLRLTSGASVVESP